METAQHTWKLIAGASSRWLRSSAPRPNESSIAPPLIQPWRDIDIVRVPLPAAKHAAAVKLPVLPQYAVCAAALWQSTAHVRHPSPLTLAGALHEPAWGM